VNDVSVLRVFRPEVDNEKCSRCGQCETFCPDASCMLSDDGVLFDHRFCKGCGVCSNECPFGAISMVRE